MMFFSKNLADKCKVGAFVIDNFDQVISSFLILIIVLISFLFLSICVIVEQHNCLRKIDDIGDIQKRLNRITSTLSMRNVMNDRNIANEMETQNTRVIRALENVRE